VVGGQNRLFRFQRYLAGFVIFGPRNTGGAYLEPSDIDDDKLSSKEHNRTFDLPVKLDSGVHLNSEELSNMRSAQLLLLLVAIALITDFVISQPALAEDGAAIYKAKCAVCHGAEGQGKVGPALKGTSLSADQITNLLTKGDEAKKAPHKKAVSGLSADDAKAVAEYVKSLK
jgi:mono/diheme cytochrome c family protein